MGDDINAYDAKQTPEDRAIIDLLRHQIESALPEAKSKVWHGSPAWFLEGNPVVGYSKLKGRVRLMFWSGADFEEQSLQSGSGKFKDAHIDYTSPHQIDTDDIARWLEKSKVIQWNYKDIIKHKGVLEKL